VTKRPLSPPAHVHPRSSRPRRIGLALVGLASLTLVLSACGSSSPGASPTSTTAGGSSSSHATTPSSGSGNGPVTRPGSNAGSGSSGNHATGSYSVAFAACMRAHGVPRFPNPNGRAGILGPGSGLNPASPAFKAAVSGPCKSLAPAGWVSSGSGPVTK